MTELANNITLGYASAGGQLEKLIQYINKTVVRLSDQVDSI